MLNNNNQRELAYIVKINDIKPIPNYDRVELAIVNGWTIVVRKGDFKPGDLGVYFEIDSKVPPLPPFAFLESKKYHIKTQKMCSCYSQGLLMKPEELGIIHYKEGDFLTERLGVTYISPEDNKRKNNTAENKKKNPLMRLKIVRNILKLFKKEIIDYFPTHFPYIKPTDQERIENRPWVLENRKDEYWETQKCDGTSATYILEKKFFGYEFYVCSRNRRILEEGKTSTGNNEYLAMAKTYNIKSKLMLYMKKNPNLKYVCWQGEICGPGIQKNPHGLSQRHLFLFHMIDSERGKWDITEAKRVWQEYNMETVPILNKPIKLPTTMEEIKNAADGFYDASVCELKTAQKREGLVYYKTTDPNFSFKNVSRDYLLKH